MGYTEVQIGGVARIREISLAERVAALEENLVLEGALGEDAEKQPAEDVITLDIRGMYFKLLCFRFNFRWLDHVKKEYAFFFWPTS